MAQPNQPDDDKFAKQLPGKRLYNWVCMTTSIIIQGSPCGRLRRTGEFYQSQVNGLQDLRVRSSSHHRHEIEHWLLCKWAKRARTHGLFARSQDCLLRIVTRNWRDKHCTPKKRQIARIEREKIQSKKIVYHQTIPLTMKHELSYALNGAVCVHQQENQRPKYCMHACRGTPKDKLWSPILQDYYDSDPSLCIYHFNLHHGLILSIQTSFVRGRARQYPGQVPCTKLSTRHREPRRVHAGSSKTQKSASKQPRSRACFERVAQPGQRVARSHSAPAPLLLGSIREGERRLDSSKAPCSHAANQAYHHPLPSTSGWFMIYQPVQGRAHLCPIGWVLKSWNTCSAQGLVRDFTVWTIAFLCIGMLKPDSIAGASFWYRLNHRRAQ